MAGVLSRVASPVRNILYSDILGCDADRERVGSSMKTSSAAPSPSQSQTLSTEQTKKQRQNAARKEAEKAAKAAAEKQRLETLAKHKRDLERIRYVFSLASFHSFILLTLVVHRMAEQAKSSKASKLSGGQTASVDAKGHLVWD